MSKILFTHSYFYRLDVKQWKTKQPYPPLATLLAAAVLRTEGWPVALFDSSLKHSPLELGPILQKESPRYLVIYDDVFNYLTKMCLTTMRQAAYTMARQGREEKCIVIISGSDATDHPEKYLHHHADFVIKGEGEETLTQLIRTLEAGDDVTVIPGLAFFKSKKTGKVYHTPPRPVRKSLDTWPLPAWDLVDIAAYRHIWRLHHGYFSLNIVTTRGCPFKCNWCAKPIYGNRYASRSPEQVVDELAWLLQHFQPDHFWMTDDIFGLKPGWIQRFRDLVNARGLRFRYKIQSRVDLLLQEDTIEALAQSGADTVWVGAESGAQKILDAMDKGITIAQIYQATQMLKQKGIRVAFFLQFGYPGETQEDIHATLRMILELMPDEIGVSVSYPLPGTVFYERVKNQLNHKQNWTDSDDLALLFQGTYGQAYYRILHRYVHSVYRTNRGRMLLRKIVRNPLRITYKDLRTGLAAMYYAPRSYTLSRKLHKLKQPSHP